jgi:hypothetical protein
MIKVLAIHVCKVNFANNLVATCPIHISAKPCFVFKCQRNPSIYKGSDTQRAAFRRPPRAVCLEPLADRCYEATDNCQLRLFIAGLGISLVPALAAQLLGKVDMRRWVIMPQGRLQNNRALRPTIIVPGPVSTDYYGIIGLNQHADVVLTVSSPLVIRYRSYTFDGPDEIGHRPVDRDEGEIIEPPRG